MEETITKFIKSLYSILNTLVSSLKILMKSNFSNRVQYSQNAQGTCFVISNGPSAKKYIEENKTELNIHDLICVNHFAFSEFFPTLKPNNYILLDRNIWLESKGVYPRFFNYLIDNTSWPMIMHVPSYGKNNQRILSLRKNKNIELKFYNYTVYKGHESIGHYFYKKGLASIQFRNVLGAAIFLAINKGYSQVNIVGGDHDWQKNIIVNKENEIKIEMTHFYDKEKQFSPIYIEGKALPIHELYYLYYQTFSAYHKLNKYAKSVNCNIKNMYEFSFIDAFEK